MTTTLTQTEDSFKVELPKQAIESLKMQNGDQFEIIPTATGLELRRVETEFDRQMAIAEQVMVEDEPALRKLAE